jgi:hypothetical protein
MIDLSTEEGRRADRRLRLEIAIRSDPDSFAREYSTPIRVTLTRARIY